MKIVVFDLDETLGYFTEFGIFWDCIVDYLKIKNKDDNKLTQEDFNEILDLFPEFLRPNIINILIFLKEQKKRNCCHKMMIYTNNNGPQEWAHKIIKYFENKINFKLIDQVIAAFKINGQTVEICRTTHKKTRKDFIRCTKIPSNAEICFLDDTFYPEMANDHIYYINVKPYYYDLEFDYMIKKFKESQIGKKIINNDNNFDKEFREKLKLYKYDNIIKDIKEYEIDKVLGKHIITHLQEFFYKSKKHKTARNKIKRNFKHNQTYKKN